MKLKCRLRQGMTQAEQLHFFFCLIQKNTVENEEIYLSKSAGEKEKNRKYE